MLDAIKFSVEYTEQYWLGLGKDGSITSSTVVCKLYVCFKNIILKFSLIYAKEITLVELGTTLMQLQLLFIDNIYDT